jgi:hypothetical protein
MMSVFKKILGMSHWNMGLDVILQDTNKSFIEEGVGHVIHSEIQFLKTFHCFRLFKLGQTPQMMCVTVKAFIKACNKLGSINIPLV